MADILKATKEKLGGPYSNIMGLAIIVVGLFILIAGVSYEKVSLAIILSIFVTQLFWTGVEALMKGRILFFDLPESWTQNVREFSKYAQENKLFYLGIVLVLSFIAAIFIISIIKALTLVVLFIIVTFAFTEGYHTKIIHMIGIDSPFVEYGIYIALCIILIFLFITLPLFLLGALFCVIGALMVTCGLDTVFNLGWNSLDIFSTSMEDIDLANVDGKAIITAGVCFVFGLGVQFLQIISVKKG